MARRGAARAGDRRADLRGDDERRRRRGLHAYADTRSQMYRGVAAEMPSTDAAVRATSGRVVTYNGKPVTTYFFSTSGGRTENVENSFIGGIPRPWLKSVKDPYDNVSPSHRWGPIKLSIASATAKLRGLVPGRLRWIRVLKRGVSPRIVKAELVGSEGSRTVTGPQLRRAFGLRDHWINFTTFSSDLTKRGPVDLTPPAPGSASDPVTGGARTSAVRLVALRLDQACARGPVGDGRATRRRDVDASSGCAARARRALLDAGAGRRDALACAARG